MVGFPLNCQKIEPDPVHRERQQKKKLTVNPMIPMKNTLILPNLHDQLSRWMALVVGWLVLIVGWLVLAPGASAQELLPPGEIEYQVQQATPRSIQPPDQSLPSPQRFATALAPPIPQSALSVRIKDITTIEGHRSNRVEGLGLVTGLKGTGGKGLLTQQFAKTMLQNYGVLIPLVATKSLSVVSVSAEIPPFYRAGEKFNATVSVLDDAQSLYGGQLLRTPLIAIDGRTYALAGGALDIGGFSAAGAGATLKKNHDTVGKVEAQLEVEICDGPPFNGEHFRLLLRNKDYTTAYRIATEINHYFPRSSRANDAGSVDVLIPRSFIQTPMDFVVMINNLRVEPDIPARVVINEKTGTIVIGKHVKLSSIVFAKDNLIISTSETPVASQPAPFSDGETVVLPRSQIQATETGGRYNTLPATTTVGDLANALNLLGVTPQDMISVFQSIEAEGSLQATLIVE
jgi:flagellar P-ring protein precursor FlgI